MSLMLSLSARRAWIEIHWIMSRTGGQSVALRKESVDRNFVPFDVIRPAIVALRKESVDRNRDGAADTSVTARRSPQGERG